MKTLMRPLATFLTIITLVAPIAASAQTTSTSSLTGIASQIQLLLQQIQALKAQIGQLQGQAVGTFQNNIIGQMGSSTTPKECRELLKDLRKGASGEDVKLLQQILGRDSSIFSGGVTGFFGQATADAVKKFQEKFGIASSTDGSFGPKTRAFFNQYCKSLGGNGPKGDDHGGWNNGSSSPMTHRDDKGNGGGQNDWHGGGVGGMVTAVGSSSVTVQGPNGITKTVVLTSSTVVDVFNDMSHKWDVGTIGSIVVGQMITMDVTVGTDGTITANKVHVGMPKGVGSLGGAMRDGGDHTQH